MMMSVCLLMGCLNEQTMTEKSNETLDQSVAIEAKEMTENFLEFKEVETVFLHNRLLVATQLKQWDKWKRNKIEKELKKTLEKQLDVEKIYVSSDYKIFIETKKLANNIKQKEISRNEAHDAFQAIVVLLSRR